MTWHERIDAAEKRGWFDSHDRFASGCWVTCACGEQDPRIPRTVNKISGERSKPLDKQLANLGYKFDDKVQADDFRAARLTLAAIEKRAAEILAELKPQSGGVNTK